jgi:hypothetical protein
MPVVSYSLEIPMVTVMPGCGLGIVILKGVIWGGLLIGKTLNDTFTFS